MHCSHDSLAHSPVAAAAGAAAWHAAAAAAAVAVAVRHPAHNRAVRWGGAGLKSLAGLLFWKCDDEQGVED